MVSHKKRKFSLILLALLIFTLFSSFQIANVQAQSTIAYTFENTTIYDSDSIEFDSTLNVRNQTTITPVDLDDTTNMETFTDDTPGGNPAGWTIFEGTGCTVNVIAEKENHDMVLQLYDNHASSTGNAKASFQFQEFPREDSFTVEFWLLMDAGTESRYLHFYEDDTETTGMMLFHLSSGKFYNNDNEDIGDYVNNVWYHIRIFVDRFMDLYAIWINNIEVSSLDSINEELDYIEVIRFSTRGWAGTNYYLYIDALGFEIDNPAYSNYTVGENLYPLQTSTDILEVSGYSFANNEDGTAVEMGQDDIPFWENIGDRPAFITPLGYPEDGAGVYMSSMNTDQEAIRKTFAINYGIIQIIFDNYFYAYTGSGEDHFMFFDIYSSDETLIARLRLTGDTTQDLSYFDGVDYIIIVEDIHNDWEGSSNFNLIMSNTSVFLYSAQLPNSPIFFDKIDTSKEGLSMIDVYTYATGTEAGIVCSIDDIAVIVDGISISEDMASYTVDLEAHYDLNNPTYFEMNATGLFSISLKYGFDITPLFATENYTGFTRRYLGFIDDEIALFWESWFIFASNESFTIDSLYIYQIYIWEGSNEYYAEITSSGVDFDDSYFYVDSSNRLRFSLTVNDNDTEHIEIKFDIPVLQTENYSVSFLSNINGASLGFFRIYYTDDTSSFFPFPKHLTTTNMIIPQTKHLESLSILITDNDALDNDYTYGFISGVSLIAYRDMGVSITTLNLMMVIVPLMVLLVPTFGISARYGKNTILPVFILMSIISFATQLIPVWLFFVIMLSCGAFLFMKRRGGSEE